MTPDLYEQSRHLSTPQCRACDDLDAALSAERDARHRAEERARYHVAATNGLRNEVVRLRGEHAAMARRLEMMERAVVATRAAVRGVR